MLIGLCEASRGRLSVGCSAPSLLGRMQVKQTQSHPPSLMGVLARFRRVRGPLEKSQPGAPVSSRACGVWALSLTFGTRLRALES